MSKLKIKNSKLHLKTQKLVSFLLLNCTFAFLLLTFNFSLAFSQETTPSPSPTTSSKTEESTGPAKSVRDTLKEKVEEKLTQLANKPRALIGKITDIQEGSLLIETKTGIKQLKLSEDTKIIDNRDDTKKNLETKDLVIGDQVIAMGWTDTKDVLDTKRILVVGALPVTTKRAVYGVVQEIKKDSLVLKHPKKDDIWTIRVDSKTRATKKIDEKMEKVSFSEVQAGDRVAVVGNLDKAVNTLVAKLIHVIPGKALGSDMQNPTSPSPTPSLKSSATPKPTSSPKPTTNPNP